MRKNAKSGPLVMDLALQERPQGYKSLENHPEGGEPGAELKVVISKQNKTHNQYFILRNLFFFFKKE